ncbi:unnamed protein product [Aphanomyces euteiches]|nr:hypothetical protein Ae201684P_000979 [Aphanomyces euteiches]
MSDGDRYREGARSRSRSKSPEAAMNTGNSLYAAGLPLRLGKAEFEEMFSKYGRLISCDLIEDPITKESRGFGFVVFEDKRDAEDALQALHDKEVMGRRIRVEKSKRSKPHAKSPGQYLGPAKETDLAIVGIALEIVLGTVIVRETVETETDLGTVTVTAAETIVRGIDETVPVTAAKAE